MVEEQVAVASAVILPEEPLEPAIPPSPSLKRRQTSPNGEQSKRFRLNPNGETRRNDSTASPSAAPLGRATERRKSGHLEERKRGQRLFGALLGTLSQSSSSTAQKRRTSIQQAKLKSQVDAQDEKKRQKKEALMVARRREQVIYDKQSMHIRHSNMLAQAQFLHTKAEPKLYYKPWEFRDVDEMKIKAQIEDAEALIAAETAKWDEEHPPADPDALADANTKTQKAEEQQNTEEATVGSTTNVEKSPIPKPSEDTNMTDAVIHGDEQGSSRPPELSKDHGDDGGEVVEGSEDLIAW